MIIAIWFILHEPNLTVAIVNKGHRNKWLARIIPFYIQMESFRETGRC